jgi:ABC-type glycerol-3-phosphate transport system substrate-binding protein
MLGRRTLLRVLRAWLLLPILVACSAGNSAITPVATPVQTRGAEAPINLLLWYSWPLPEQRTLARLVERYNRSHPQIRIIPQARPIAAMHQELRSGALEGSGPHLVLVQSHTIGRLVDAQVLLPLDDLVSANDRERLLPAALGAARAANPDGDIALYGLPLTFDTPILYYNKVNLEIPPPDTETLLRTARGLTDASTRPPIWGLAYHLSLDNTIGYLYAFGGQIFDENGELVLGGAGRAGAERWLEWLLELHQDPAIFAGIDGIAVENTVMAQEALISIDWAHTLERYRALWPQSLGVAPLPELSESNVYPQPYVQSDVIGINARVIDVNDQQAALSFMRYLLSDEAQHELLESGKQPSSLSLDLSGDGLLLEQARAFRLQGQRGQPMPNSAAATGVVWEAVRLMQFNVLRGISSPADAVSTADATLRDRLALPLP